jgi:hypothetical protein
LQQTQQKKAASTKFIWVDYFSRILVDLGPNAPDYVWVYVRKSATQPANAENFVKLDLFEGQKRHVKKI